MTMYLPSFTLDKMCYRDEISYQPPRRMLAARGTTLCLNRNLGTDWSYLLGRIAASLPFNQLLAGHPRTEVQ